MFDVVYLTSADTGLRLALSSSEISFLEEVADGRTHVWTRANLRVTVTQSLEEVLDLVVPQRRKDSDNQ